MRNKHLFARLAAVRPQGQVHGLPPGVKGVKKTLMVMERLAIGEDRQPTGAKNPEIREMAGRIVWGCPTKDYVCEAEKLLLWVQKNIRWTRDMDGVETVQTPERTAVWKFGDCDDLSTLLVALGTSIGHQMKFKAIAANPNYPNSFSHVYVLFYLNNQWVPADPTMQRPRKPLGWESPQIYRELIYPPGNNIL